MLNKSLSALSLLLLIASEANSSPWKAVSTQMEVRRDNYHGQHLYITFKEGPVTMLRALLPNDWRVIDAIAVDDGFVLNIEGRSKVCVSSKSFGRIYSETLSLDKDQVSEIAEVWEKYRVSCGR